MSLKKTQRLQCLTEKFNKVIKAIKNLELKNILSKNNTMTEDIDSRIGQTKERITSKTGYLETQLEG